MSSTAENFQKAQDTADTVVHRARERVSDAYQKVKDRGVEKEQEFEEYVHDHPVTSVLVAAGIGAGVGLIAGVLLGRR
jgi:ElaB/YqjD/DUF883 family membrane-anchored ribosome-binding protein